MHLHGFYFRVRRRGDGRDDIAYGARGDLVNTERLPPGATMYATWIADRLGNWLFHCHIPEHFAMRGPLGFPPPVALTQAGTIHPGNMSTDMAGLVTAIEVKPAEDDTTALTPTITPPQPASRRLRLIMRSNIGSTPPKPYYGVVFDELGLEPQPDSGQHAGPPLVLTRGEPVSITVINRTPEPTSVHWHGIELESYFDGVAGWSGSPGRTTPAIKPGQRFEVRLTPRRAGTFMYHTHMDEIRQQYGGLVGALVVLEPGERWDPAHDRVVLISDGVPWRVYINGSLTPAPMELEVGRTYRLRLADIAVFRQVLRVRLVGDSTLLTWRPIAKDGFALPPAQAAVRPSEVNLPSGETADFEFTPDRPGEVALEVRGTTPDPLGRPNMALQGRLPFRVSPAAGGSEVSELASAVETIARSRRPRP
jgi:hypothetical protein